MGDDESDVSWAIGWVDRGFHLRKNIVEARQSQIMGDLFSLRRLFIRHELVLTLDTHADLLAVLDLASATSQDETSTSDPEAMRFRVASRLALWLESIRMLLDQTDKRICDAYGDDSSLRAKWKHLTNHAFDTSFSYRFFYHLRNKSHQGLPPVLVSTHSAIREDGSPGHAFEVSLSRSALLLAFESWHATVRADLEDDSGGDELPLREMVEEHQSNINSMILRLIYEELELLHSERDRIALLLDELADLGMPDGAHPVVFRHPKLEGQPKERIQFQMGLAAIEKELVEMFDDAVNGSIGILGETSRMRAGDQSRQFEGFRVNEPGGGDRADESLDPAAE